MDSSKQVLIVDDSKLTRMIISKIISVQYSDWKIVEAVDSSSALIESENTQYEFITLDYNMPGASGYEVYPQLRQLQPDADIAIFTANIQSSVRKKFEDLGAKFYSKPINQDVLINFFAEEAH